MSYLLGESDGCFVHAFLLVTGRSSSLEYFRSTMAAHRAVPGVWADYSKAEYKEAYSMRFPRISEFIAYLKLFRKYSEREALLELSEKIKPYPLLPENSQSALASGLLMTRKTDLIDYGPAIIQLAKSVEIALKTCLFDAWRESSGSYFLQTHQISALENPNSKAKKLTDFAQNGSHIELGSMRFILSLKGGKTEKKEPLLQDFFRFVSSSTSFPSSLDKGLLKNIEDVSRPRNAAAHSEVFTNRSDAQDIFDLVVVILNGLTQPLAISD